MDAVSSHSALEVLLAWILQHPGLSGLAIFAVAMLESLLLVGIVVPGALLMLAIGALVAVGALDLWTTIAWAVAGAVIGDGLSYWIGYAFRDRLRRFWPLNRFPALVDRGEAFFRRHGGKSVVFGRFVGPVRPVIPTIAGMMGMSPARFTIINVLSALVWAPAYLLPGVVFGASLKLASEVAWRLALMVLVVVSLLLVTGWIVRRVYTLLQPRADTAVSALLRWGRRHPALGPLATALVDPRRPESRALVVFALVLVAMGAAFFAIVWHVAGGPEPSRLDALTYELMRSLRTPWMDAFMVAVTMLGDAWVYVPLGVVVFAWLLHKRDQPAAVHWLAALGFGAVLSRVLKVALHTPRPSELYNGAFSFAFPSTHATMAAVTYGFLAVLLARELPVAARRLVYVSAGLIIVLIGASRVYLGAHWLSDVAGGLTLGLAWIALLGIAYRRHAAPPLPAGQFLLVLGIALPLLGGMHVYRDHGREMARYALRHPVQAMAARQWWAGAWAQLPAYVDDLGKRHRQPFNLQWAGPPAALAKQLQAHGWHNAPPVLAASILQWLSPKPDLARLPILPHVNAGRHETLLLVHPGTDPNHQWILRLWPSDRYLTPGGQTLWLGSVSQQYLARPLGMLSFPVTGTDFDAPLRALLPDLNGLDVRAVRRPAGDIPAGLNWNGEVVLLRQSTAD